MKRKVLLMLSWSAVIAVCVCIFLFSGTVAEESSEQSSAIIEWIQTIFGVAFTDFVVRKAAHVLEYTALGFFSANAFYYTFKKIKIIFAAFGFSFLYSISDEIHQLFVPGRAGQIRDVLIDTAGIAAGIAAWYLLYRIVKQWGKRKHD